MRSVAPLASLCCVLVPGPLLAQELVTAVEPPLVEIGASLHDPADQLFAVSTARFLADGRIVVAEAHDARVRVYDAGGRHLRDLGGQGPGPGELAGSLQALTVGNADTVLLLDASGARLRFVVPGEALDDVPLRLPDDPDARFNIVPWGVLRDGRLLLRGNERLLGRPDGRHTQHVLVLVHSVRSGTLDTIGVFAEQDVMLAGGMPWPTAPRTTLSWAPGSGDDLWIGSPGTGSIRRFGMDGREQLAIDLTDPRVAVRDDDIDEMVRDMVRRGATANDRRVIREWALALPRANEAPAFRGMFTDRQGRLWVERWVRAADGASRWDVYERSGRRALTVSGPPGMTITDARDDLILGVVRDADDRELIRVHRLQQTAGSRETSSRTRPLPR